MVTLSSVAVSRAAGVEGDFRGALKPGRNRRQLSLMEAESWAEALADLRVDIPWWSRRANLLVEGLRFPREAGIRIRIGKTCLLEVTMECDPCRRMEEVAPGLEAALRPDWRGGLLTIVREDGHIALGDEVRIEG